MGYNIFVLETNFRIAKQNSAAVLNTIKGLYKRELTSALIGGSQMTTPETQDFAFIRREAVLNASNVYDVLSEWRWLPLIDDEGNVENLEFIGEKLGDEQILFDSIAPFVEADSYIVIAGDDGKIWRWLFEGGNCRYETGKVVFPRRA